MELLQELDGTHPLSLILLRIALEIQILQKLEMSCLQFRKPFLEIRSENIADTKSMTRNLICICRSDTFQCRTDFALSGSSLISRIQKLVCRENEMSLLGNQELSLRIYSQLADIAALFTECNRVENDTASDDIGRSLSEDS